MTPRKPGAKYRDRGYTTHTIESIMARTVEVGECMEWCGYIGNDVPQVAHRGRMVSVRRLVLTLRGVELNPGDHAGVRCNNPRCVCEDHIVKRSHSQHAVHMCSTDRNDTLRRAKLAAIARASRAKLTMEQAREIRLSDEAGPVLAERYGVNKSVISRIRRGESWQEHGGMFSGLMNLKAA